MNREQRRNLAEQTLVITERGWYERDGRRIDVATQIRDATDGTIHYTPEALESLHSTLPGNAHPAPTRFEVHNETTLSAAARLVREGHDVVALNFASARHPGGGFLSGASAQEESIARASALYPCLAARPAFYERNRAHPSALYLDDIIYSPRVPVFRDDDGGLLHEPYTVSIITSPAANRTRLAPREHADLAATMKRRAANVLAVAAAKNHDALILGAWGCGVFGNHPQDVADWISQHLDEGGRFANAFERVIFAVLDFSEDQRTFRAFQDRFG